MSNEMVGNYLERAEHVKAFIKQLDYSGLQGFVGVKLSELKVDPEGIDSKIFELFDKVGGADVQMEFSDLNQKMEYCKNVVHNKICESDTELSSDLQQLQTLFHVRQIKGLLEFGDGFCALLDKACVHIDQYTNYKFERVSDEPGSVTCVEQWSSQMMDSVYRLDDKRLLVEEFFDLELAGTYLDKLLSGRDVPVNEGVVALPICVIGQYDGLWFKNLKNAVDCVVDGEGNTPLVIFDPYRAMRDFTRLAGVMEEQSKPGSLLCEKLGVVACEVPKVVGEASEVKSMHFSGREVGEGKVL